MVIGVLCVSEGQEAAFPRGVEVVVGVLIENAQGYVLVTQSPKWQNKWITPGGHVEAGETLLETATRETLEETGLVVLPQVVIGWREMIDLPDFERRAHLLSFRVHCLTTSEIEPEVDGIELTSFQWVTLNEALNLDLAQGYREMMQDFITFKNC